MYVLHSEACQSAVPGGRYDQNGKDEWPKLVGAGRCARGDRQPCVNCTDDASSYTGCAFVSIGF